MERCRQSATWKVVLLLADVDWDLVAVSDEGGGTVQTQDRGDVGGVE